MSNKNDNLIEASLLLRDFYAFDARLTDLYEAINGEVSDETSDMLRRETDHVEAIIKRLIEEAAIDCVAA